MGAKVISSDAETEYAYRVTLEYDGDLKKLVDYVEDVPEAEVLSIGHSLEIVKDLGDAEQVSAEYGLDSLGNLELRTRVEKETGVRITATDITTIRGLADAVCEKLEPAEVAA